MNEGLKKRVKSQVFLISSITLWLFVSTFQQVGLDFVAFLHEFFLSIISVTLFVVRRFSDWQYSSNYRISDWEN